MGEGKPEEKSRELELEKIRGYLRRAAEMKDPKNMFVAAQSAVELLAIFLNIGP